jgi:hypothetical protein
MESLAYSSRRWRKAVAHKVQNGLTNAPRIRLVEGISADLGRLELEEDAGVSKHLLNAVGERGLDGSLPFGVTDDTPKRVDSALRIASFVESERFLEERRHSDLVRSGCLQCGLNQAQAVHERGRGPRQVIRDYTSR